MYYMGVRLTPFHSFRLVILVSTLVVAIDLFLITHEDYIGELDDQQVYPESIYTSKWAKPVSDEDVLHLSLLHEACLKHRNLVIPWVYGLHGKVKGRTLIAQDDPNILESMRQCPDVDIFLPLGIRHHGYCEDAVGYTKYLQSRMLPAWAITMKYVDKITGKTFSYHDLCPKTPIIFMNHYWDGIPHRPEWPRTKQIYLMANIEMYELQPEHYWGVHVVLCKTAICARRVRLWYQQQGNPNNTTVFYTRHTSSDIAAISRARLEMNRIQNKDYTKVKFIHVAGSSMQKGTPQVLECWLSRPDFPPLDLYMSDQVYKNIIDPRIHSQINKTNGRINIHIGRVAPNVFGKVMAEATFALCTSPHEGYGHYINQARATGAVIIAANIPPMNELLSPQSSVLFSTTPFVTPEQLLGGSYDHEHGLQHVSPLKAWISSKKICGAVDHLLDLSPLERQNMGKRARIQYHIDTNYFAFKMSELRKYARAN